VFPLRIRAKKEAKSLSFFMIATILCLSFLSGCSSKNNQKIASDPGNSGIYKKSGNTINRQEREEHYNPSKVDTRAEQSREFGYVRQVKSPIPGETIQYRDIYTINREKVADAISKLAVSLPNVHDAASLVTDEEVLVAYRTNAKGKKARFDIADQVKRTAMSVVPRWYHVYVTDDPTLRQNVENLASLNGRSANRESMIQDTVNMMLKSSPQGRRMSSGENANGEAINELNGQTEDPNDYRKQKNNKNL
jgi:hypothetical protein